MTDTRSAIARLDESFSELIVATRSQPDIALRNLDFIADTSDRISAFVARLETIKENQKAKESV